MVRMGYWEGLVDFIGIKFILLLIGIFRFGENRKFCIIFSIVLMGIVIKGLVNILYFVKFLYMVRMEYWEELVDFIGIRFI